MLMEETEYENRIKALEDEIRVMKERYRILSETTPALLFEYKPEEDVMVFLYNFPDNKKKLVIRDYQSYIRENPLVHPDHLKGFLNVLMKASKVPARGEIEYLSKVSTGEFEWHKTFYSSIADEEGGVISVLGRIYNIHKSETAKREMQHRIATDTLTGLYNRDSITERVGKWLKNNPTGESYMVMIDIDDFKKINDNYGHSRGDEVLKEVARLLLKCFGDNTIFSRFGGDEFLGLVMEESAASVQTRADHFMQCLEQEITLLEDKVHCSIGIAGRLSKYDDFEDLFNRADNAMYEAKNSGKNRYYVYKE
jgi:diguanylate cyclase (GGDEF)-like protein